MKTTNIKYIEKEFGGYKSVNTKSAKDKRLSPKAKGVMFYLLSKPDNWKGQIYDIVSNMNCGKATVQSAMKELRLYGYVELIKTREADGRLTSYYKIYDYPKLVKRVY